MVCDYCHMKAEAHLTVTSSFQPYVRVSLSVNSQPMFVAFLELYAQSAINQLLPLPSHQHTSLKPRLSVPDLSRTFGKSGTESLGSRLPTYSSSQLPCLQVQLHRQLLARTNDCANTFCYAICSRFLKNLQIIVSTVLQSIPALGSIVLLISLVLCILIHHVCHLTALASLPDLPFCFNTLWEVGELLFHLCMLLKQTGAKKGQLA